jgi:hypothetical protein
MSIGSSLPRSGPHHSSSLARNGGGTWKTSEASGGRGLTSDYTNYMMTPTSQHQNKNPSTQLMGLINGNGNGPNNVGGDPYMAKQGMPSDLSSPWHPHPPSLLQPPPLIPHHMQSEHHSSHHSSSTLHSQQNLQHHDNIVSLNDVDGGMVPGGADLNEESATSDLATSFFGYRYPTILILFFGHVLQFPQHLFAVLTNYQIDHSFKQLLDKYKINLLF